MTMIEKQQDQFNWEEVIKAGRKIVKAVEDVHKKVVEKIVNPLLLAACAENPRWYYYYKNAKTKRTYEKYRTLLYNKLNLMIADAAKMNNGNPNIGN